MTVERAMFERRSVREYQEEPLSLSQVAQILWSAQGITSPNGYRTSPSAGALYPLELYLIAGEVEGLEAGVYKYDPRDHTITGITSGDLRKKLTASALNQSAIQDAPLVLVLCAVYERTSAKYGERGSRYVHMEIGFAAENIYLQAQALNLGTVFIGAFHDDEVKKIIHLEEMEQPLGIMPVGVK
jgi:SagB-type dehydrogenase family enzyme